MPGLPPEIQDHAVSGTVGAALAAIFYKVFLRLRGDHRDDKGAQRQADAYGQVLKELRAEVERLGKSLFEVSSSLDREITMRRQLEEENNTLRWRVAELESQVATLKSKGPTQ